MTDFKRALHETKGFPGQFTAKGWTFNPLQDPGWYQILYKGRRLTDQPTLTAALRWAKDNWRRIEREYLG